MRKKEYYEAALREHISKTAATISIETITKQASFQGVASGARSIAGLAGLGGVGYLGYKAYKNPEMAGQKVREITDKFNKGINLPGFKRNTTSNDSVINGVPSGTLHDDIVSKIDTDPNIGPMPYHHLPPVQEEEPPGKFNDPKIPKNRVLSDWDKMDMSRNIRKRNKTRFDRLTAELPDVLTTGSDADLLQNAETRAKILDERQDLRGSMSLEARNAAKIQKNLTATADKERYEGMEDLYHDMKEKQRKQYTDRYSAEY